MPDFHSDGVRIHNTPSIQFPSKTSLGGGAVMTAREAQFSHHRLLPVKSPIHHLHGFQSGLTGVAWEQKRQFRSNFVSHLHDYFLHRFIVRSFHPIWTTFVSCITARIECFETLRQQTKEKRTARKMNSSQRAGEKLSRSWIQIRPPICNRWTWPLKECRSVVEMICVNYVMWMF